VVVLITSFLFFVGVEAWKFAKRVYFRRQTKKKGELGGDAESRMFSRYLSMDSRDLSDSEKQEKV
jgi:P-type Na+/K+ transporter